MPTTHVASAHHTGQLLLLGAERMYADPAGTMRVVATLLGLQDPLLTPGGLAEARPSPFSWEEATERAHGSRNHARYPPMLDATRQLLRAFFAPFNEQLRRLLQDECTLGQPLLQPSDIRRWEEKAGVV